VMLAEPITRASKPTSLATAPAGKTDHRVTVLRRVGPAGRRQHANPRQAPLFRSAALQIETFGRAARGS
jgi:hypothetical protein